MATDRAVILARRKVFIVSALAGLGGGCDRDPAADAAKPSQLNSASPLLPAKPQPSTEPATEPSTAPAPTPTQQPFVDLTPEPAPTSGRTGRPGPCLSVAPPKPDKDTRRDKSGACNPPYYLDNNGVKRVKKECL